MTGSCVLRETILKGISISDLVRGWFRARTVSASEAVCLCLSAHLPSMLSAPRGGSIDHAEAAQSNHSPGAASGYVYAGQTQSRCVCTLRELSGSFPPHEILAH